MARREEPSGANGSSLARRVARRLSEPAAFAEGRALGSLLSVSGAQFGLRPEHEELTQPTGFDPRAVALFEAIVESAFLVATADGVFDEIEERTFCQLVLTACNGGVSEAQVKDLLADLATLLREDGLEGRIAAASAPVRRGDHAREVIRIAALMAHASSGVSEEERRVLGQLAAAFELSSAELNLVIAEIEQLGLSGA